MIFTAYFDEADTHGASPTVIMAAFLGHAYQWRRFETKIARLQKSYGFKVFHAKNFKARNGDFSGWPTEKCNRLIHDLNDIVARDLAEGFSVYLERDRYLNEYRAPPIPRKMNLDSQYGVCFRACLSHLLDRLEERGYRDRLNVVMESGHANVRDCERIFGQLKTKFRPFGWNFLGDFTVSAKEDCNPLMVADMLAGAHSMMRQAMAEGALESYKAIAVEPGPRKGLLTFLELKEDALAKLKTDFDKVRQIEIAYWREQRELKRATSGVAADVTPVSHPAITRVRR